jgi:hypothetical protein
VTASLLPSLRSSAARPSVATLVFAVAIPVIFLHPHYQPSLTFGGVTANLTDVGIAAVAIAAIVEGVRRGFTPLRAGISVWMPLVAFVVWILLSLIWARRFDPTYALGSHLVSAAKFAEYVVLAPAVPLIVRRPADRRALLWAVVIWSSFLTLIAVLQFLGLVNEFKGRRPGQREPSFIGVHDLGAFSGAALSIAFAGLLLRSRRTGRTVAAGLTGAVGIAVAAALDSVGGMWLTAVVAWGIARRRASAGIKPALALAAICGVATVGAVSLRGSAIEQFLRFLGIKPETRQTQQDIQTYAHRTLLGYIGLKIWVAHPLIGVGWQESAEEKAYGPVLPAAHRRFSTEAPQSFPAPQHPWGVQNGIIQTLADLGIVGLLLLAAAVGAALTIAGRAVNRGPPQSVGPAIISCGWIIFAIAVFTGSGLLPGLPVDALLWLGLGLAISLRTIVDSGAEPA